MNKELIKKYKEEFDWWLDGKPLLYAEIINCKPRNVWLMAELKDDYIWDYNTHIYSRLF